MTRRLRYALCVVAAVTACTEDPNAPGRCPEFCPPGSIDVVDTILTSVIVRDSAFRGYLSPQEAAVLIAANVPAAIDSRPIIRFQQLGTTLRLGTDTTQYPITATDSALFALTIVRRDTNVENLRVNLYRMPVGLDTTTTFASLAGPFTDSLVRSVNVDSLLALPGRRDTATGDSVRVDGTVVLLILKLDSAAARFVAADSGELAYGVRIQADAPATVALGSNESGDPPLINWYFKVDSAGTPSASVRTVTPQFDSYVFTPAAAAIDSTLAVGGMPSARSLLRIALPAAIADSTQVLRATLVLVPSSAMQGAVGDSFAIVAHAVSTDLGAKSPLLGSSGVGDSSYFGMTQVYVGSTDTVNIEITRILRRWAADTAAASALVLRSAGEGGLLGEIRFQPSRHATLRPALHLTYSRRFPFGSP